MPPSPHQGTIISHRFNLLNFTFRPVTSEPTGYTVERHAYKWTRVTERKRALKESSDFSAISYYRAVWYAWLGNPLCISYSGGLGSILARGRQPWEGLQWFSFHLQVNTAAVPLQIRHTSFLSFVSLLISHTPISLHVAIGNLNSTPPLSYYQGNDFSGPTTWRP